MLLNPVECQQSAAINFRQFHLWNDEICVRVNHWQPVVSPPDQMSVEQGTMPTAAQAGRLSPGETSALFVSIIISLVPPLIWITHASKLFITVTCRHPAHCCFYWNIPAAAYHIQSWAPSENVLYPQQASALMEEKRERQFKQSGLWFNRPHNHIHSEYATLFFTINNVHSTCLRAPFRFGCLLLPLASTSHTDCSCVPNTVIPSAYCSAKLLCAVHLDAVYSTVWCTLLNMGRIVSGRTLQFHTHWKWLFFKLSLLLLLLLSFWRLEIFKPKTHRNINVLLKCAATVSKSMPLSTLVDLMGGEDCNGVNFMPRSLSASRANTHVYALKSVRCRQISDWKHTMPWVAAVLVGDDFLISFIKSCQLLLSDGREEWPHRWSHWCSCVWEQDGDVA